MNWLETNISERLTNKSLDFKVIINKSNFDSVSFDIAAKNVSLSIANSTDKNILILLSGGMDSEFVVRKFKELKIDFTPVIVDREGIGFREERDYAYKTLRDLNITNAKILKLSDKEAVKIVYEKIYKNLNSNVFAPISLYACEFAQSENSIIIDGNHLGGFGTLQYIPNSDKTSFNSRLFLADNLMDQEYIKQNWNKSLMKNGYFYLRESEVYALAYYKLGFPIYSFFMHTPQIVFSMLNEITEEDYNWNEYKSRIYKINYRPKLRGLPSDLQNKIESVLRIKEPDFFLTRSNNEDIRLKNKYPNDTFYLGNKQNLKSLIRA